MINIIIIYILIYRVVEDISEIPEGEKYYIKKLLTKIQRVCNDNSNLIQIQILQEIFFTIHRIKLG